MTTPAMRRFARYYPTEAERLVLVDADAYRGIAGGDNTGNVSATARLRGGPLPRLGLGAAVAL